MRIGLFLLSLSMVFSTGCSSLFWRTGELEPVVVPSGKSQLIFQVVYLERDSWNPLMGTTIKKSYQTRLTLIQSNGKRTELPNLNSWVLPGKLVYMESTDQLFWIQGKDDEYGTLFRKAGVSSSVSSNGLKNTRFWESEPELLALSPSPNGELVAYIFQRTETSGIPKFFLAIWNPKTDTNPSWIQEIANWDESDDPNQPLYGIQWRTNSELKVKMDKKQFTWMKPN